MRVQADVDTLKAENPNTQIPIDLVTTSASGLDPDALPESDPSKMNFGSTRVKPWKDIWGSGQGIGAVKGVVPAAELIARLKREYEAARVRLGVVAAAQAEEQAAL